jgi:hypothetical protein
MKIKLISAAGAGVVVVVMVVVEEEEKLKTNFRMRQYHKMTFVTFCLFWWPLMMMYKIGIWISRNRMFLKSDTVSEMLCFSEH